MTLALSKSLQALSDPTRREILRLLRAGDMSAGQIAEQFDMTAPSVSHHLSTLKNADLVQARRDGQTIIYALNATVLQELMQAMLEMFQPGAAPEPAPGNKPRKAPRTSQ
jgi:ArsR family transcriptional regulator, arsenate/arsenite/antimonite-responsive transcriptional repressor